MIIPIAIVWMSIGAIFQFVTYFKSIDILSVYGLDAFKYKWLIRLWPLIGAIAWPAVAYGLRKATKK